MTTYRLGAKAFSEGGTSASPSSVLQLAANVETRSQAMLTASGPDILKGTSGTRSINLTGGAITLHYRPTRAGTFKALITIGSDTWFGSIIYKDADGDEVTRAPADAPWSAYEPMDIRIIPATSHDEVSATLVWEYDARDSAGPTPSGAIVISSDTPTLVDAPGAVLVNVGNGVPGELATYALTGNGVTVSLFTSHLDDDGVDRASLPIPKVDAGLYTVTVTTPHSGSASMTIAVQDNPLDSSQEGLPEDDIFPPPTDGQRWTFLDRYDPSITHTMARNPASWTNPNPPNHFTHDAAVAPNGQILTWQAARRPYPLEFSGYLDSQAEYDALQFWADRRRRFWLIDHRNRAWVVTFEHLDARARVVPNKPWAHDYTVKAVVFRRYD